MKNFLIIFLFVLIGGNLQGQDYKFGGKVVKINFEMNSDSLNTKAINALNKLGKNIQKKPGQVACFVGFAASNESNPDDLRARRAIVVRKYLKENYGIKVADQFSGKRPEPTNPKKMRVVYVYLLSTN